MSAKRRTFSDLLESHDYLFVDFHAQWCGPCRKIGPEIDTLSEMYPQVYFKKVDIEKHQNLADQYKISSLPTFLLFERGNPKPIERIEGANLKKVKTLLYDLSRTS